MTDSPAASPSAPSEAPSDARVLLVRHGRGRGRIDRYLDRPLARLDREAPGIRARLRVHETGGDAEADLRGVRAVAFFLADPLEELYPACHREAVRILRRARERGLRVLNPPDALSNTRKLRQARLWREAGLPTPPCRSVRRRDELWTAADELGLPLVVRSDLEHAQQGLRVCRSRRELEDVRPRGAWLVASPLVDVRATYRRADDGWRERVRHPELWRRHHHKSRAYVVDGTVVPYHHFFSPEPAVSMSASLYGPWRGWLLGAGFVPWPLSRLALLSGEIRRAVEEEKGWLTGAPRAPEVLRRAVAALGLDYAAVDYATRADGSVVLWEANPHPAELTPGNVPLRRERGADRRTERLYGTLGELFGRLLRDAGDAAP